MEAAGLDAGAERAGSLHRKEPLSVESREDHEAAADSAGQKDRGGNREQESESRKWP